jgi:hypothetical protein
MPSTFVTAYRYQNELGELLFTVERYRPKRFRILDAAGRECETPPAEALYRWPQLRNSAHSRQCVCVVEGEKDAESLSHLGGLIATTNPGGCRMGWRAAYSQVLKGRDVVILPDCDAPGRRHAEKVRASLERVAASVVIVELPGLRSPQDVSDWIAMGGTKQMLDELVEDAMWRRWRSAGKERRIPHTDGGFHSLVFSSPLAPLEKLLVLAAARHAKISPAKLTSGIVARMTGIHPVTARKLAGGLRRAGVLGGKDGWRVQWAALANQARSDES